MKRVLSVTAAGILAGVIILAWGWFAWTGSGPDAPTGRSHARVRVPQGMTLSAAADTLVARGLLRDRRVLLLGARLTGRERGLRAGLYELAYGQSPRALLDDLTTGISVQVAVTIPEGLHCAEIAEILATGLGFRPDRFLTVADSLARRAVTERRLLTDAAAIARHDSLLGAASAHGPVRTFHWSEGLLAPDTYHFAEGTDPLTAATTLLATQLERLDQAVRLGRGRVNAHLTPLALLTLASVVEAEARREDERALIAAVYSNRLARNWRLEADPTVAFLLDKKGKRLFYKDLKVPSPYNTYRNRGLPPGPIGTPGQASLRAAAVPDSNCQALYFVSDGGDGHVFSRTAQEHEAAVRRFRSVRTPERRQVR